MSKSSEEIKEREERKLRIDSHSHIFSLNGVEYHQGMPLLDYQKDIKVDMCGVIAGDDAEQELLVETVRKYPDKFYGIGYVDHKNMYSSLKKIEEYIKEGVIRGIKMHPYVQLFQLDAPEIFPIYELALTYDIPVIFHVGWLNFNTIDPTQNVIADYRYSCMGFPVQFGNVMERYPKLKLIIAHMGGNYYFEMLAMAERFENVYLDTAWLEHWASHRLPSVTVQEWIEHAVRFIGSKKVLYGGEGTVPEDVEKCSLTKEQLDDILGGNAKRIYNL